MPSPRKLARPGPITLTLFRGRSPYAVVEHAGLEWSAFVAQLPALLARTARDKRNMPAFLTAAFDGGYRSNDTVGEHTALIIDVDDAGADPVAFVRRALRTIRCVVYESPSSTDEAPRFRLIAALAKPYPAHAVPAARAALARALKLDPKRSGVAKAAAPAQIFFAGTLEGTRKRVLWVSADTAPVYAPPEPGAAPERTARCRSATAPTSPVHAVNRIPNLAAAVAAVAPAPDDATGQRRGGREAMRALGGVLARLGYDPAAIGIAVAEQIPSSQPDERAAQAADAAEAYYAGEERTAGAESLERTLGADVVAALREANGDGAWEARAAATWAAPSHEPTPVELEAMGAGGAHPTADGSGKQANGGTGWPWIVQFGAQFWIHEVGKRAYRTKTEVPGALESAIGDHLSGVIEEEERSGPALRNRWIVVADKVRLDYTARAGVYDPARRELTVPALEWAALQPTRHEGVERWLMALAGDGWPYLRQWLAAVPQLDRPAPCLYLIGGKGLGKTLLGDGLAAIWSVSGPCKMREATGAFNGALASCPMVMSDEGFPPDFDFARFRDAITARSVSVNRKYGAQGSVEGCARFMIAANNDEVLRYQRVGTLTQADIEAIASRLLVLRCDEAAAAALLGQNTKWIAEQGLAEYALWLHQNVALESADHRMAARPQGGEALLQHLVDSRVTAGKSSDILLKIWEAVGSPAEHSAQYGVWVRGPEVWVNTHALTVACKDDGLRVSLADAQDTCRMLGGLRLPRRVDPKSRHQTKVYILSRAGLRRVVTA